MENEENSKSISDYLQIIKRRKTIIIIPILIFFVISLLVALILPPIYRSDATILIEQQSIPLDMVRSTVVSYVDQRIMQIEKKLMTVNNLNKIINKFHLYPHQVNKSSISELAYQFRKTIYIDIINQDVISRGRKSKATLAFKLAFEHKNPIIAQKVASELATLFLNENIKSRTKKAKDTALFLANEAKKYSLDIQNIELNIALYKEKNRGSLPELLPVNLGDMSRIENHLLQLNLEEKMLVEKEMTLQGQLLIIEPILVVEKKEVTTKSLSMLKEEYELLLSKYSASHPDSKALKRLIDNFVVEEIEEIEAGINNPTYLQIQSSIRLTQISLKNINQQKQELHKKLKEVETNVAKTAKVESGYYDLTRNLENYKNKYQELKAKALEASLSQTLEEEQKSERFTLLEPPAVPLRPLKPKRLQVLLIGFALSIGVGFGIGFLVDIIDGTIRGSKNLAMITGSNPLIVIPYIDNQEDTIELKRGRIKMWVIFICFLLISSLIITTHLFYTKLYKIPDKIQIKLIN